VLAEMVNIWSALAEREKEHRVPSPREPDLGFAWATYRWASGHSLEAVLRDAEMQAGDFVRWTKQVMDLLGQIADADDATAELSTDGPSPAPAVRDSARAAIRALRRGVVAYSSVA
jgi:ATP-dependent RNA helicase HelY